MSFKIGAYTALFWISLFSFGCAKDPNISTPDDTGTIDETTDSPEPTLALQFNISINQGAVGKSDLAYGKRFLKVPVGATVTWVNNDVLVHTVTEIMEVWDSNYLKPGEKFSYTFNQEGEYIYYDVRYGFESMSGKIIVVPANTYTP